jgi:hypothetical protein
MLKIVLLFSFVVSLYAFDSNSCYSVQVNSFEQKSNTPSNISRYDYPQSCKFIKIDGLYSVRCGCYKSYNEAQELLLELSDTYYDALVINTDKKNLEHDIWNKSKDSKKIIYEKDSFEERYNRKDNLEYGETGTGFYDDEDLSNLGYE